MEKIKQKHGKENMKVCRCFEIHLHCNTEQGRTRGVQGNPVIKAGLSCNCYCFTIHHRISLHAPCSTLLGVAVYFHVVITNIIPANGADISQYEDKNRNQTLKTLKCKSNFRLKILSAHGCSGY